MASTNPARGMRDFLPADVRKRNYVIGIIKEVYESYGFEPLETPAVENIETLTGKYGEEGNQLIFKILKRGEKLDSNASEKDLSDLALRYDLTVPLARVVANHKNDLPKFFKRYQIQPVWRADRPARGRFREFYQCDVDAIGSSSMVVEAELISAVSEILRRLGFDSFAINLNHRKLLTAILEQVGILPDKQTAALVTLDKIDKIGPEEFERELLQSGIEQESINEFADFMGRFFKLYDESASGPRMPANQKVLSLVKDFLKGNEQGLDGVRDLEAILENTHENNHIFIDAALARGLSYYTGSIMEIEAVNTDDNPHFAGSLAGGGRYDGLIGMFGKEQIPACGFSLGLERILVVMDERNMFPPEIAASNSADVMVTIWNEDSIGESLKLANDLRQQGLRVTVYPEADKLGKQLKYADTINVPFACILGDEEKEQGKVQLKDMNSGEKFVLTVAEITERIQGI